jgi:predicted tellurium resistance membrane protein TerC
MLEFNIFDLLGELQKLTDPQELLEQWPALVSMAIIEILLSVDNMLGVRALAEHLNPGQRRIALIAATVTAYIGRCIGLMITAPLLSFYVPVRLLGAAYLIYIMSAHFTDQREKVSGVAVPHWGLGRTILGIVLLDVTLSFDNIVAAVSLSKEVWVVCSTVVFGLIFIQFLGKITMRILRKLPILSETVYLLVGWVGMLLMVETFNKWKGLAQFTFENTTLIQLQQWGVQLQHSIPDLNPEQKLIGLLTLIGITLLYDGVGVFQKILDPILRTVGMPLLRVIHAPLHILFWPLRGLLAAVNSGHSGKA